MLSRFRRPVSHSTQLQNSLIRWCLKCDNEFIGKDICHNEYSETIIDRDLLLQFLNMCCDRFNIDEISYKEDIEMYANAYIQAYSDTDAPISDEINSLEIVELLFNGFSNKRSDEYNTLEEILNEFDERFALEVKKLCNHERFIYKL
jgi:hypothetical protein